MVRPSSRGLCTARPPISPPQRIRNRYAATTVGPHTRARHQDWPKAGPLKPTQHVQDWHDKHVRQGHPRHAAAKLATSYLCRALELARSLLAALNRSSA